MKVIMSKADPTIRVEINTVKNLAGFAPASTCPPGNIRSSLTKMLISPANPINGGIAMIYRMTASYFFYVWLSMISGPRTSF